MIDTALKIIKDEIQTFLRLKMKTDSSEEKIYLAPAVDENGKIPVNDNSVSMSLVKIEEDRVNTSYTRSSEITKNNKVHYYNPPVRLNLYVLFAATFSDYTEALKFVSYIISFFQSKNVFTPANTPALDPNFGRITMELYSQSLEEQNYLWAMLGSSYRPSVLYKLRMLTIQEGLISEQGAVAEEIDLKIGSRA